MTIILIQDNSLSPCHTSNLCGHSIEKHFKQLQIVATFLLFGIFGKTIIGYKCTLYMLKEYIENGFLYNAFLLSIKNELFKHPCLKAIKIYKSR